MGKKKNNRFAKVDVLEMLYQMFLTFFIIVTGVILLPKVPEGIARFFYATSIIVCAVHYVYLRIKGVWRDDPE
jgi:E3 ubiquitin-protein ligase DOA10